MIRKGNQFGKGVCGPSIRQMRFGETSGIIPYSYQDTVAHQTSSVADNQRPKCSPTSLGIQVLQSTLVVIMLTKLRYLLRRWELRCGAI